MRERKGGFAPFLLSALLVCPAACSTQRSVADSTHEPPAKILFVGNSFTYYNNSLHNHYSALIRSAGDETTEPRRARILTISGGHLPEHAGGFPGMVASEDWDVVVMQGHSKGPISEETAEPFRQAARKYSAIARQYGAEPALFMTWAYAGQPEMTQQLDDAYTAIGKELDAKVVPVGLAFARVTAARPDIALRIADNRHPTLEGTYLAACTFYAALFDRSPRGLSYTAGLDAHVAEYLQSAAWTTVSEYAGRTLR